MDMSSSSNSGFWTPSSGTSKCPNSLETVSESDDGSNDRPFFDNTPVNTAPQTPNTVRKPRRSSNFFPNLESVSGITSIPRKLVRRVRKSLSNDFGHGTDKEQIKEIVLLQSEVHDDFYDPSRPSMRFNFQESHAKDPKVIRFMHMQHLNQYKLAIGGMIKLHQYCYNKHKLTREPVFRDAANFWRNADGHFLMYNDRIPVRMAFLGLYSCERVEPWYRDFYQCRDISRFEEVKYDEDNPSYYDEVFNYYGQTVTEVLTTEIRAMGNYCFLVYNDTEEHDYLKGVNFWRSITPLHLPRNYQLALLMKKKEHWENAEVEQWFRPIYEEVCFFGARGYDVYPAKKNDNEQK